MRDTQAASLRSDGMNETCEQARGFLNELLGDLGLKLNVTGEWSEEGCWILRLECEAWVRIKQGRCHCDFIPP